MWLAISLTWPGFKGVLEILVMAFALYYIMLFFHGTRGAQVLTGLALLLVSLLTVCYVFNLDTLIWIIQRFSVYLAVALMIIFQPEIRRALAEIGQQHIFSRTTERSMVDQLVRGISQLAEQKIGALVAIEREMQTRSVQETGTALDAQMTPELLTSIFYPHTPLHDGGVIIRDNRIVAAGCLFPLSQREGLNRQLGTRHRAAIGLSEETDALVLVVSEETGTISVAYRGRLRRGLDTDQLERILTRVLQRTRSSDPKQGSRTRRAFQALKLKMRGRPAAPATSQEAPDHA